MVQDSLYQPRHLVVVSAGTGGHDDFHRFIRLPAALSVCPRHHGYRERGGDHAVVQKDADVLQPEHVKPLAESVYLPGVAFIRLARIFRHACHQPRGSAFRNGMAAT